MAKTLSERLASVNGRISTTDLEQLIVDVKAERDAQAAQHISHRANAINFKLAESDRDDAAQSAERAERNADALAAELEDLEAKLLDRRQSDKSAALEAQRKAALGDRDALAERIKAEWPILSEGMMTLFEAIEANDEQLRAAGLHEANAEAAARGIPGNWYRNSIPIKQFTKMQIPDWEGSRLAWPRPPVPFDMRAALQKSAAEIAAQMEANAPKYLWHRARVTHGGASPFHGQFRDGTVHLSQISNGETDIQITEHEAERLNAIPGITVTKLDEAPPEPDYTFKIPGAA